MYAAASSGISFRQGGHQLAQKEITTGRPLSWESRTFAVARSRPANAKSGACSPIFTRCAGSGWEATKANRSSARPIKGTRMLPAPRPLCDACISEIPIPCLVGVLGV